MMKQLRKEYEDCKFFVCLGQGEDSGTYMTTNTRVSAASADTVHG